MRERRAQPVGGRVAHRAILRESRGRVRGRVRPVVIRLMASPAGRAGQAEIIIDVTLSALNSGVHSGQREPGSRMIESRAQPVCRRLAARAILRKSVGLVGWIGGSVVIGLMAVPAVPIGQAVVVVHMALRALQAGVCSGEREPGGSVVEGRARPVRDRVAMAQRAVLWETCRGVRRTVGAVVIGLVAVPARRAGQTVIVVHMAGRALLTRMQPYQGKSRGGVVERRSQPVHGRVAAGAILREIRRLVGWICGSVVIGLVAVPAISVGQGVIVVHVALRTLQIGVRAGQRESGSRVVKGRARPIGDRRPVADRAVLWESG